MIEVRNDILNTITKYTIFIATFTIVFVYLKTMRPQIIYNFIDLQMKYKNYIIVNKKRGIFNDETYVFEVENPVTHQRNTIYVEYYLYHNVYFVGDTIK